MSTLTATEVRMGRPRGFDEDAALEAAMRVFWEKSYEGATMADLTNAMGMNRSSIYAAFGDKEALFRRAVDRYSEGRMTHMKEALAQPTLLEVTAGLINEAVEFLSTPGNPRGCLSVQGALACSTEAEPVKQAMIEQRKSGDAALKKRVQQAKSAGELPGEIQPQTLPVSSLPSWQALAFKPPAGQQKQNCGVSPKSHRVLLKPSFRVR